MLICGLQEKKETKMKIFGKMLKVEGRLSIRDMNMIIFAEIMPLVILVILGIIYGQKEAFPGAGYTFLQQSFGALCSVAICAGGLMGLPIVISEYRERKLLKRYQVTPISQMMILFVHLAIYALYSLVSVLLLWGTAAVIWGFRMKGSILAFFAGWFLVLVSILSIGILVGGLAKNSKSASVIASVLYFPMLVFSGATLPYEIMPEVMQKIVNVLPLTQGIKILKAASLGLPMGNVTVGILVMVAISVVCIGISAKYFRWE